MSHQPPPVAAGTTGTAAPYEIKYFFIRRPVLGAVISIVITLLGLFAIHLLPIARYPQITPPAVRITTNYAGAAAEDAAQAVAAPIEQQLAGLQGLLYYSSANSSDGTTNISVTFDVSRNQDLAAVDVQNAEKLAEPQLPDAVRTNGVTILKANTDILAVVALRSADARYDATYLANYMKLYLVDELKRVPGVGDATPFPARDFAMRIELDPEKMAQLGITVSDVAAAVREQNATNPAGRLGAEPSPVGTPLTLPITTLGRLTTTKEFNDIIVRARPDGSIVRISDIGNAVLGAQSYDLVGRLNGKRTAFALLYSRPGANALDVKAAVVRRLDELQKSFPQGVTYALPFDTTPFVSASIKEVAITLVEAMLLVTAVVFLFLQSWRATLIPMLAVPVSVIGTFLGLLVFGMSINVLTLFGLVLAIGIVVDDAIVVIENVERIMATQGLPPRVAADIAIRQVASALVAIVLVLCSVFVPVAFIGGVTGALFKQFAMTIVIAVVLSGIVALTLTPALCALLLKEAVETHTTGFFGAFNRGFTRVTNRYVGAVDSVLGRPAAWIGAFAVLLVLAGFLWTRIPSAFLPTEDKGYMAMSVQLPDASSLQRTEATVQRVEQIAHSEPAVQNTVALVGLDLLTQSNSTNAATVFVSMKPWEERSKHDALDSIAARINGKLFAMRDAVAFGFNLPEVPGLGLTAGVEINLQNRNGQDIREFAQHVQQFSQAANKLPASAGLNTSFRASVPQVFVNVDRTAAKSRGVNLTDLFATMQAFLSSLYINDFNLFGKTYRVQATAAEQYRQSPSDIGQLYVRGTGNQMVPVSALTTTTFRSAPTVISRFNGFTSAQFTGSPKAGHSTGELLNEVDQLIQSQFASAGLGVSYSGQSFQERASSGAAGLVFVLGLIMVFLVLAAQFESWSVPFAVLLAVPFGVVGSLLGIFIRGQPNDIYFQVGLITVVGLAAKNAILIVEFASELRGQGMSIREAAVEAARERLRPILMTSFAFILGVVPLMLASGAGAASRHSIGTGVFAGMLFATTIGIFFIPLFFRLIRGLAERRSAQAALAASIALGACSVGPRYKPETVIPPEQKLGAPQLSDSTRRFFDSLAVERRRDSIAALVPVRQPLRLNTATVTPMAWMDIIHDSVLVQLIGTALNENRDVRVALARIDEYRADLRVARAPELPRVALNASESSNQVALGAFPTTSYRAARATADLAWELDFWGRTRHAVEAARADLAATEAAQRATALSLVSDVASGYLQLLELDQERAIAERTLSSRKATLEIARQRYSSGLTSELDVRQFEAQVAAPAVTLAQSERALAQTEHNLNVLIGEAPATIPRGRSLNDAVAALSVPDSIPAALLARRPDVVQAEREYAAAVARIGVAEAARWPAFNITGSYGGQTSSPQNLLGSQGRVYQALIGLSFPVFDNGALAGASAAARARAEQARASYEGVALNAMREANDALAGVRTSRDEALAQATQANALRQALDLATVRYEAGLSSYLDLLDAQRSLFGAELGVSQAQLGEVTAAVRLYRALGGSWRGSSE